MIMRFIDRVFGRSAAHRPPPIRPQDPLEQEQLDELRRRRNAAMGISEETAQ